MAAHGSSSRSWLGSQATAALLALSACGGGQTPQAAAPSPSSGQVAPPAAAAKVSYYAAARFAEQASFGPTPTLVAALQAKGFEKWIDEQFALPTSQIDVSPYLHFKDPTPDADWQRYRGEFPNLAAGAADQLRLRVSWSISQFLTVSDRKGDLVGALYWINMLQRHSLSRYDELLYQASIHPMMGQYLDNIENRPKSSECLHCAPNENFARELMQLFSIGVHKLKPDGTPERDARGRLIETYTQRDVEELARVLTGWEINPEPPNRGNRNWANWAKPLVATTWPPLRDTGRKQVLGREFPAGQSQDKDLRDAIDLLMKHPNIAPFVSLRLIQHLVKSNPSPAYVGRVAARFRNNGSGVAGDLKAVVKAVLLDAEARAGDHPATARADDGKFKEPFLHALALWRGLGCRVVPPTDWEGVALGGQTPFNAESVFSFYAPTDRAPGSNLLAPEQRLLTGKELRDRVSLTEWPTVWDPRTNRRSYRLFDQTGCDLAGLRAAFVSSPRAFNDYLTARYFRGAMPPTLRSNIEQMMKEPWPPWNRDDPSEGALRMLGFALATPYFGVSK